jgi:RimJ/RimL family protein N-acetyltransferase
MHLETSRLILRDYTPADFDALHAVLSDAESMRYYPHPFSPEETAAWIARNLRRYETDGFGLWAAVRKDTGEMIGDCGITLQPICEGMEPEIGYHIRRDCQNQGFASEAAAACVEFAFLRLKLPRVFSYMKRENAPSARVAVKCGMRFYRDCPDPDNGVTRVYSLTCEEWTVLHRQDAL